MQEQEASQEEKASLVEVAGSQWEAEGRGVSVGVEVQWVVACLLEVGWVACLDQRVAVQKEVVEEVLSSSQKEVGAA